MVDMKNDHTDFSIRVADDCPRNLSGEAGYAESFTDSLKPISLHASSQPESPQII